MQLRVDEELREIKEGLRRAKEREQFVLESAEAVRYRDLRRAVLDNTPNIVHFSGHGAGEDGLVFEDESGQVKLVDAKSLAGLFKLFADTVECVVLNACYSQVQAEAIAEHIPFVVGMGKEIGDKAAIEFAIAFYDAIGSGRGYKFAFDYACNAIDLAGIPEGDTPKLLKGKAPNAHSRKVEPVANSVQEPETARRSLMATLNALIPQQFNSLLYEINPPAGIIPPYPASQADRVYALMTWAESPTGIGLNRVQAALDAIINPK
jgi:hypothetical protein